MEIFIWHRGQKFILSRQVQFFLIDFEFQAARQKNGRISSPACVSGAERGEAYLSRGAADNGIEWSEQGYLEVMAVSYH